MAEGNGIYITKGKIGNVVFYMLNGKQVARTIGKVSKKRMKTDKAYARVRENRTEFGAASMIGKNLRTGFAPFIKQCGDPSISWRLNSYTKRIISEGVGERGKRSFEISKHKTMLHGFEFNIDHKFGALFSAPFSAPVLDVNTFKLIWAIPVFNTDNCVTAPDGATHFKLLLVSTLLGDYVWDSKQKKHVAVHKPDGAFNTVNYSDAMVIGGNTNNEINLTSLLNITGELPASAGIVIAVGICFYQEVNGELYALGNTSMRIEGVV